MKSVYCVVRTGSLNKAVCCVYLRTNSDLCHLQHKLIGFYNRDEKCLLRGTHWAFKYSSLRFVFKGLNMKKFKVTSYTVSRLGNSCVSHPVFTIISSAKNVNITPTFRMNKKLTELEIQAGLVMSVYLLNHDSVQYNCRSNSVLQTCS